MPRREALGPVTMQRVALLAPREVLRDVLAQVADEGCVAFAEPGGPGGNGHRTARPQDATSGRLTEPRPNGTRPVVAATAPDLEQCEQRGRFDLVAGEAEIARRASECVERGRVCGVPGWAPSSAVAPLAERLRPLGAVVVPLPRPPGVQPPTLLPATDPGRPFAPLVETYSTVPYADVNPSLVAGLAYVAMFGMMFADAGHGILLLLLALVVRQLWWPRLRGLQPAWVFLAGAGAASVVFGLLYGEFFGPTGVVPALWLTPLEHPVELLAAALAAGAVLLAAAYALGSVNRYREGGWRQTLYAPSGLAGSALFLGLGAVAGGLFAGADWAVYLGCAVAAGGLAAAYVGLFTAAGGGGSGAVEAGIELFDLVIRLGANLVSFARLAAFGLTHAALAAVVWTATVALWDRGGLGLVAAVVVFLVGTAVAFGLEGLIAAIQALRLEYYELFSRVFVSEGVPFRPWHVPMEQPTRLGEDPHVESSNGKSPNGKEDVA
ncbi:V-type ATPase 116kDa subunit family protein [Phycicoccus sp. SLBN-51]|uniref:V-type ATPase 116kDa subunit family protein n=1 Tax=Phycicoccus sp. SLBN-51 TaxID=2768447 RepID=UPI0011678C61|nr:V-type ATPase 116kDa subunit family protein [Phycicoccus sp. SLBN-51]TQJ51753.1 V/A-type H+-transporting ATPase subunit I [Phycicoccus sp. SLBN-51]